MEVSFISNSPEDTIQFGREFARGLEAGDVIALSGEMGSGKTMLAKGICLGLGYSGTVTSPSYVKVHQYDCDPQIIHADFYLINSAEEAMDLGLDEFYGESNIVMVEWAQSFKELMPVKCWWIEIEGVSDNPEARRIRVTSLAAAPV